MKLFAPVIELLKETYNRVWEFDIAFNGAAIAFYAIFSTAPLVIIFVWIASAILGSQIGEVEFQQAIQSVVGNEIAKSITKVAKSTSEGATGFWSSLIAILTLLFAATTLLSQLKLTLNKIWGASEPNIGAFWYFLRDRLVALLFIGSLSLLFFLGMIVESVLYGLEYLFIPLLGNTDLMLFQIGSSMTNMVLAFTFFTVMFKVLPDIKIRWRDIAVGALVTTILFLAGKAVVDWYMASLGIQAAYKAAGSFVIFLIWIYYNVQVVLIGAIFTKIYTDRYGGEVRSYWGGKT